MAVTFEGYERRIDQIMPVLNKYGIKDSYETHMMYSDEKSNYSPVSLSQLQKYFADKKNNIIDKKILILSLKSCFYREKWLR